MNKLVDDGHIVLGGILPDLRTVHAMPSLPGVPMPSWAPRFWKRFICLPDRVVVICFTIPATWRRAYQTSMFLIAAKRLMKNGAAASTM